MHKYQPDRAIGSTWHPLVHNNRKELAIQEDETAIVIIMLGEYLKYSGDQEFVDSMYDSFVRPAAEFMCNFIDSETNLPHASYDLWEEKFMSSTYTAAVTFKALEVAAEMASHQGIQMDVDRWQSTANTIKENSETFYSYDKSSFIKGFLLENDNLNKDETIDISSFYGSFMFNYYNDENLLLSTLKSIETELLDISPSGGTARYENDNYFKSNPAYKGNPWFVTTLWMAQYYALNNNKDKAIKYVEWTLKNSMDSGLLSEQINPENSKIVGVTPLVWSHAELINTILEAN
jgi:GH15 family glucan-1,4-alpha-glucosidase